MNIAVLYGGLSNERDVSISSGTCVANALRERGHNVVLVDLFLGYTEEYTDVSEVFLCTKNEKRALVAEYTPDLDAVKAMRNDSRCLVGPNVIEICSYADMTFLALHGEEGENGKLQAMLDIYGIKYTGTGYLSSALAMNKYLSKKMFSAAGITVPEGIVVSRDEPAANVGFPCVVKPCSGGSSVGTSIVWKEDEYRSALEFAFRYEDKAIVEKYIKGRELTMGVMDGKAMPSVEIIPKSGFYDYKNKYQAGATVEICPAPIGEKAERRMSEIAEKAYEALGIEVYCRVDFLWDEIADEMYVLEINTLPGMTPTSLIPQMAAEMGMDYGALCEKIIEISMKKY